MARLGQTRLPVSPRSQIRAALSPRSVVRPAVAEATFFVSCFEFPCRWRTCRAIRAERSLLRLLSMSALQLCRKRAGCNLQSSGVAASFEVVAAPVRPTVALCRGGERQRPFRQISGRRTKEEGELAGEEQTKWRRPRRRLCKAVKLFRLLCTVALTVRAFGNLSARFLHSEPGPNPAAALQGQAWAGGTEFGMTNKSAQRAQLKRTEVQTVARTARPANIPLGQRRRRRRIEFGQSSARKRRTKTKQEEILLLLPTSNSFKWPDSSQKDKLARNKVPRITFTVLDDISLQVVASQVWLTNLGRRRDMVPEAHSSAVK